MKASKRFDKSSRKDAKDLCSSPLITFSNMSSSKTGVADFSIWLFFISFIEACFINSFPFYFIGGDPKRVFDSSSWTAFRDCSN